MKKWLERSVKTYSVRSAGRRGSKKEVRPPGAGADLQDAQRTVRRQVLQDARKRPFGQDVVKPRGWRVGVEVLRVGKRTLRENQLERIGGALQDARPGPARNGRSSVSSPKKAGFWLKRSSQIFPGLLIIGRRRDLPQARWPGTILRCAIAVLRRRSSFRDRSTPSSASMAR